MDGGTLIVLDVRNDPNDFRAFWRVGASSVSCSCKLSLDLSIDGVMVEAGVNMDVLDVLDDPLPLGESGFLCISC